MFYPTAPGLFSSTDMLDFGTLRTMGKPIFKPLISVSVAVIIIVHKIGRQGGLMVSALG